MAWSDDADGPGIFGKGLPLLLRRAKGSYRNNVETI